MDFNQYLLQKRIPLKTINFPWSLTNGNLTSCFDVINLVLNARKSCNSEQSSQVVSCRRIVASNAGHSLNRTQGTLLDREECAKRIIQSLQK
jgi:hypothetical protein